MRAFSISDFSFPVGWCIYLVLCSVLLIACGVTPYSKEKYLTDYESFAIDVKRNWQSFSHDDWIEKEKENNTFFVDHYKTFAGELSASEKVRIHRFNFVFMFYHGDVSVSALLSGKYNQVFTDFTMETNEVIRELKLALNDFETERNSVLIDKLLD